MSYNQKPPGSSGSGMGGGPPNGPNNIPQVAKTFAGIQQQMQNLVHSQNAIPQSSQADINAFLQQQRIQNMLKQQQQFLQFQHQMQQQQHQQQQHHNMVGGSGVGPSPVGGVPGVGGVAGSSSGGAGGSGEPLALTRTAGAAELLSKTYQQQANGNPVANPTFDQLQQTLQALPTNFVQQLQAIQYQMQAKQIHQQQHGVGQGQHVLGQQQPVQGVPSPNTTTTVMGHQHQHQFQLQQQQQKHQNQHQQQQQQNALTRYLTAAAAQVAAVSGNKMPSATPPPPPPLTNQMKPPNLPPNTQITPLTAANIASGNMSGGSNPKMSTGNTNTGAAKHTAPSPSISLMPSKQPTSGPSVAHQQNKFTPPTNSGAKGVHMSHSQNLPKSTHGATHTATSNTISSPAKTVTTADTTVAALKSPQSTPVQLTKQTPTTATAVANKTLVNASATSTVGVGSTSMVSSLKSTATTPTTAVAPTVAAAVAGSNITTTATSTTTVAANASATVISTKTSGGGATKAASEGNTVTKLLLNSANTEKEAVKTSLSDTNTPAADSNIVTHIDNTKKETEKAKENILESRETTVNKPNVLAVAVKDSLEKAAGNDLKSNMTTTSITKTGPELSATQESKAIEEKIEPSTKPKKSENQDINESEKKLSNAKKFAEKNDATATVEKNGTPASTAAQGTARNPGAATSDDKKATADSKQMKNSAEEGKLENKEKDKAPEEEKDKAVKPNKSSASTGKLESVESKVLQRTEPDVNKSKTFTETKTTATAQIISVKSSEKNEANTKNHPEANNRKNSSENSEQNKKIEKLSITAAAAETEARKIPKASSTPTENKRETVPKDNKGLLHSNKLTENSETMICAKTTQSHSSDKTNTEDNRKKDSTVAVQKETTSAATTTVKKLARHPKGAKSKSVAPATPTESKIAEIQEDKPAVSSARVKRKPKAESSHTADLAPSTPKYEDSDRKSTRHRLKTILYQSPLPELAFITKLSASEASNSPKPMSNEDRLIVFYKNEYLAVRNAEGTFYLCQTMQNVYRTSPRISIRWLSEDAKDSNVFIPDFYDHTDIECVLTTVELKRIDKGHLRLPKGERNRIESILKKAIDVEKGLVPRPELTEENPDGLDISLFKDESQIEKKSALTEGSENQTPSVRKSKRGKIVASSSSTRKSTATVATPSTSAGTKRKRNATAAATSSSFSSRKTLTKKRKTLMKRKKMMDNSDDDDDDDDETSDDCESDAEYKPTQKRSSLNVSGASRSAPRAQRSPLAKARAASPITPTTSRSKNVPQKPTPTPTPTPSTSKASRGERAAKRKSITEEGSFEEALTLTKKPTTTSNNNNKNKASDKHTSEATAPVKKSSLIDNSSDSRSTS